MNMPVNWLNISPSQYLEESFFSVAAAQKKSPLFRALKRKRTFRKKA